MTLKVRPAELKDLAAIETLYRQLSLIHI